MFRQPRALLAVGGAVCGAGAAYALAAARERAGRDGRTASTPLHQCTKATASAQLCEVVRVPRFLSDAEIDRVIEVRREHARLHENGETGRSWQTTYLHADGLMASREPERMVELPVLPPPPKACPMQTGRQLYYIKRCCKFWHGHIR